MSWCRRSGCGGAAMAQHEEFWHAAAGDRPVPWGAFAPEQILEFLGVGAAGRGGPWEFQQCCASVFGTKCICDCAVSVDSFVRRISIFLFCFSSVEVLFRPSDCNPIDQRC